MVAPKTLAEFISDRLTEIDNLRRSLLVRLEELKTEENQLHLAASAAGVVLQASASLPAQGGLPDEESRIARHRPSEKTIKQYVLEVLKDEGRGMTALDILASINKRFGTSYPRTSLSPQLSRLKGEGKLERDGVVWSLKEARPLVALPEWAEETSSAESSEIKERDIFE